MWNRRHGEDGDTPTCSIYINNSCQTARFCAPSCQSHLKNFQDSATTPTHSRTGTQYTYTYKLFFRTFWTMPQK